MAEITLVRNVPSPGEFLANAVLTPDNFGVTYIRWPYDPAVTAGEFTSLNPSKWHSGLEGVVGWVRTFDPNIFGRYSGGSFVQDGTTAEGTPQPYGRMVGGTWSKGMLKTDGTYDFTMLDLVVSSARAKGMKVLMMIGAQGAYYDSTNSRYIEYPLPTGEFFTTGSTAYQTRFRNFMDAFLTRAGNGIHAIEIANEPAKLVRLNTVVGAGYTEQLAIMCRITKSLIASKNLSIKVCSPPFQGGETGEITSFLTASAVGISVNGSDGTGTVGRDWVDVVGHHNYGSFSDRAAGGSTTAMDAAAINDVAADAAYPNNTTFTDLYAKAVAVKTATRLGGWTGPLWNTEFNTTGQVDSSLWYPRKMTTAGLTRTMAQMLNASIIGGYDKHILYAVDHPTLGFYDDVGTPPAGESGTWYFKAPDNTARGVTALSAAIRGLIGAYQGGRSNGAPFYSVNRGAVRISTPASAGVFSPA